MHHHGAVRRAALLLLIVVVMGLAAASIPASGAGDPNLSQSLWLFEKTLRDERHPADRSYDLRPVPPQYGSQFGPGKGSGSQGIVLDGSAYYVDNRPNDDPTPFGAYAGDFTVSVTFKYTGAAPPPGKVVNVIGSRPVCNANPPVSGGSASSGGFTPHWNIYLDPGGRARMQYTSSSATDREAVHPAGPSLYDGRFHEVTMRRSGSTMLLVVDGAEVASKPVDPGTVGTQGEVWIGSSGCLDAIDNGLETRFVGVIDQAYVADGLATPAPVNQAPKTAGDAFRTDEDTPLSVPAPGVLANDKDPEDDAMSATLVDGPAQGTLSLNPNGSFTYMPVPDANGPVTFTYRASDAAAQSEPATVTLTVTSVNDVPVATDDAAATVVNARVEVPVTKNDSDLDGDALTATPVSVPAHGIATCSGGTCTYAPAEGFTGRDAFTYAVSDDRGGTDRAQVRITVVPLGTPEAADDLVTTPEDTEVRVDVLANDVLGDQPTTVASRPPARGTLLGGEGGSFTYRPAPNDDRDVDFTYTITDADRQRSSARVRITITPVNDPPSVPPGASFSTGEGQPLVVGTPGLLTGVVDVDGDRVRVVLASDPPHGTVDLRPDGSFTYTPDLGYGGPDEFTYRASDGTEASAPARAGIDVTAVRGATEERPPPGGDPGSPPAPTAPLPPGAAPPGAPVPPPPAGSEEAVTLRAVSPTGAASGPPGVALEVSGSGFGGCDTVFFFLDDVRIGAAPPDDQGDVRSTGLSVPGDARTGSHTVTSSCRESGVPAAATTSFDVTAARLHRNALVTSLHRPDQIPLDLRSLAISSVAALSLMLLIAFPSELFNKTLEENYDEVRGWFGFTQPVLQATRRWPRHAAAAAFLLVAALLYSFLSPDFWLNLSSLITVVAALVGLVGVIVLYDLPALVYMRVRYGERGRLEVLPGTVLVAVPCVVVSRLLGFQPGYIYGLLAFFAFQRMLSRQTEGRLFATQAVFLLGTGLAAWLAWTRMATAAAQPGASFWVLLVEAILGGLFVASLETATFALMPFRFVDGNKVIRWNRVAWIAVFGLSAFVFIHILLRPGSGYVGRTADGSLLTVEVLFLAFAAVSVGFWGYFRFRRQPTMSPTGGAGAG